MNGKLAVTTPSISGDALGRLLFGEQVAEILIRKKSSALPDASLTSTLYNLVQQLVDD